MNYKPFNNSQVFNASRWTESLDTWKKAQADKEVAYRAFIKKMVKTLIMIIHSLLFHHKMAAVFLFLSILQLKN